MASTGVDTSHEKREAVNPAAIGQMKSRKPVCRAAVAP